MKSILIGISALAGLVQVASSQQTLWGQCGGIGWTGPTSCVSGACCTYQNPYYSQCLSGNCNSGTTTFSRVTTSTTTSRVTSSSTTTAASDPSGTLRSSGCGRGATLTSGTKSMTVNGKTRQYILRLPNNYDQNKPYKLIFGFHWLSGTMANVATGAYYGLQQLAGESAIFVAPQGLNNGWANSGDEDITFVDQMISTIESGLCVNQRLRFATGFSYGGAMSFSLACSRATTFRAVAVLSGGQLSGCSGGNDPIAYLGIHGLRDSVLNISGGRSMRDRFVRNNGCASISPSEPNQGSQSHIKTSYNCRSGYPVTWIAFDAGHISAPADGSQNDSPATFSPGETWSFFNQFT